MPADVADDEAWLVRDARGEIDAQAPARIVGIAQNDVLFGLDELTLGAGEAVLEGVAGEPRWLP
ncbi:MAG TPA: hypothetical protein VMM79_09490 [Longimicrobiales bacterium]|nr:hypothetical protein [Longimicrobiales bacterium]